MTATSSSSGSRHQSTGASATGFVARGWSAPAPPSIACMPVDSRRRQRQGGQIWTTSSSTMTATSPTAPRPWCLRADKPATSQILTDDDLEELKGFVDLGFGFSYHEIPDLCGMLLPLELCYSMSQKFLDEHQQLSKVEEAPAVVVPASPAHPVATNWKISSPGDSPDEVKARLKYWAQAVA